jgi:hypothetical protein
MVMINMSQDKYYGMAHMGYMFFTVFRLLTDFVCLYNYEFWLSLCKIVRSSVILLLPLFMNEHYFLRMVYVEIITLCYDNEYRLSNGMIVLP